MNGPSLAARGERVAAAWFTKAEGIARVRFAISENAGASFGEPVSVAVKTPHGRADVTWLDDGTLMVAWLDRAAGGGGEIRVRRYSGRKPTAAAMTVARVSGQRADGFPRIAALGEAEALIVWTEGGNTRSPRVRAARITAAPRPPAN